MDTEKSASDPSSEKVSKEVTELFQASLEAIVDLVAKNLWLENLLKSSDLSTSSSSEVPFGASPTVVGNQVAMGNREESC